MNKHIELVKKWLADNDSVTSEELDDAAEAAAANAHRRWKQHLARNTAAAAADADAAAAARWVKKYEELTSE